MKCLPVALSFREGDVRLHSTTAGATIPERLLSINKTIHSVISQFRCQRKATDNQSYNMGHFNAFIVKLVQCYVGQA